MKKLMITAAAAAMVSGAFAVNDAQVYDYTATLKVTACREGKVSASLLNYFEHGGTLPTLPSIQNGLWERGDVIGIRKQVTVKIAGVIWGCDCPTISIPGFRPTPSRYLSGYYFWNQQNREIYNPYWDGNGRVTTFSWNVLNRIDTMTKCEGSYILACRQPGQRIFVFGAGFGKVSGTGCDSRITSMSGNLAGFRDAPRDEFGCVFCLANGCVVAPLCDLCVDDLINGVVQNLNSSAVSGTWKIKYNSNMARRLRSTPWISRIYTFNKAGNTPRHAEFIDRVWSRISGRQYGADFSCEDYIDTEKAIAKCEDYVSKMEEAADDYDYSYYSDVTEKLTEGVTELVGDFVDVDDSEELEKAIKQFGSQFDVVASDVIKWANDKAEADENENDEFDTIIKSIITAINGDADAS